jgi:preprotein translocase subunit YajC
MFGVAFGLAALVAVGGMAFAVGRWSVDDTSSPTSALAGGTAAAPGQQGQLRGGERQRGLGGQAPDGFGGGQAPDANPAQAQDPGEGEQGLPGRGQGFRGGFGRGGIVGIVAGVGDIGITVQPAQGETLQFVIDDDTSFVREMSTDGTSLVAGESVRVQFPLPQFNEGQAVEPAPGSNIATLVTVLRPGEELNQGFRGGQGDGPRRGGQDQDGDQRQGRGQGLPGGFASIGTQGVVTDVADGSLTLDLANGETQQVATDAATQFVREEDMDPSTLRVGDAVRIQVPRGGFGRGGQQAQPEGPRVASRVTVVPAAQ